MPESDGKMTEQEIKDLVTEEKRMVNKDKDILFLKELKNEMEAFCYDLRNVVGTPKPDEKIKEHCTAEILNVVNETLNFL